MSDFEVAKTRFFAGAWEGVVRAGAAARDRPDIEVSHQGQTVAHVLTADPEDDAIWNLRIVVPVEMMSDGVQVFLIADREAGETLASFTIVTGEPLAEDIRAEVELLRAELDMLKRAFRRHCLETS
jgi:hypothetical protein